jgi:hypothetical protein
MGLLGLRSANDALSILCKNREASSMILARLVCAVDLDDHVQALLFLLHLLRSDMLELDASSSRSVIQTLLQASAWAGSAAWEALALMDMAHAGATEQVCILAKVASGSTTASTARVLEAVLCAHSSLCGSTTARGMLAQLLQQYGPAAVAADGPHVQWRLRLMCHTLHDTDGCLAAAAVLADLCTGSRALQQLAVACGAYKQLRAMKLVHAQGEGPAIAHARAVLGAVGRARLARTLALVGAQDEATYLAARTTCGGCGVKCHSLRVCSGCRRVWYCGVRCQQLDWQADHAEACGSRWLGPRS